MNSFDVNTIIYLLIFSTFKHLVLVSCLSVPLIWNTLSGGLLKHLTHWTFKVHRVSMEALWSNWAHLKGRAGGDGAVGRGSGCDLPLQQLQDGMDVWRHLGLQSERAGRTTQHFRIKHIQTGNCEYWSNRICTAVMNILLYCGRAWLKS